jgi:hypothetical protein
MTSAKNRFSLVFSPPMFGRLASDASMTADVGYSRQLLQGPGNRENRAFAVRRRLSCMRFLTQLLKIQRILNRQSDKTHQQLEQRGNGC